MMSTAHYQRARAAGARIDSEPVDQPYGQREMGHAIPKATAGGSPCRWPCRASGL